MEKEKEKSTKKKTTAKNKTVAENKKSTKVVEKKEKEVKEKVSKKNEEIDKKVENKDIKKKENKQKKEKKKRVGIFKAIFNFFKGVKDEMSRVVWPTKRDMVKYSIATIIFVVVFAIYFYGIEVFMAWLKSIIVIV